MSLCQGITRLTRITDWSPGRPLSEGGPEKKTEPKKEPEMETDAGSAGAPEAAGPGAARLQAEVTRPKHVYYSNNPSNP